MPYRKEISEQTIEALKRSVLDAVIAVDARGDVVGWNGVASALFGWTEEQVLGRPLGELIIPPVHRDAHQNGMARYASDGLARVLGRRIEITAVNRDGVEFPVELSIIEAPTGGDAAFIGFIRDISDRRLAQVRLTLSEESLRLATDSAEIGTWDLDLVTDVLTWSDRTKAMFGISPGVPCSMVDFYDGLHPDDRDGTGSAFASALDPERRATYDVEYRTIGKEDRRVRWVAAKGKGIFDGSGTCVRAIGTAIDITARKLAEARREVMAQLTDLLNSADTNQALDAACALMGHYFGVSRVGYGQLDPKDDIFEYTVCWTDGNVPPLLGQFPASAFGEKIVARLSAGETVVVDDLFANALSDEDRTLETATEVDTRAILVVPFLRGDRLRTIVYLNSKSARHWASDEVEFMVAVADRTRQLVERAEAEAAVAASEAEFRTFAQAMPNHVWAADSGGMLYWLNDQSYAYTGAQPGSLIADAWSEVVHQDDRDEAGKAWTSALGTAVPYETQFRIRRHDGAYRWFMVRALPITGADDRPVRWIGTNTDIHDQKEALDAYAGLNANLEDQVKLRTQERNLLATVFESTDSLILVVDLNFRLLAINAACAREFATVYGPTPKVGDAMLDLLAHLPAERDAVKAIWGRALCGEEFTAVQAFGDENRDRNTYEIKFNALRDDAGLQIGAYQIVTNINARVEAERKLAETQDALRQAQKMEAVGQLTGGIAHDFNNMLAVVSGSLELLDRRTSPDDARSKRNIAAALEASRRAGKLTQRLLAFARQQPLRPEITDPNRLVAGMADLFQHSLGTDVQLETVLGAGIWRVHIDQNQLENVLLNLAVNARDAMPGGGKLTIETQNTYIDQRYADKEAGLSAGQYVLIAVTDTGTGMPDDVIAKAFDPFFTTKEVGKGTGLGLSQVYGFIKQSGGHVRIYSELGHGTTIKLYLPRQLGEGNDGEISSTLEPVLAGEGYEVILVVDDEAIVRQFSVDALTDLGYRVLEAAGAKEAFEILENHPEIDLLFTDIIMPEMNGRKLADLVKQIRPALPVVFTTGYTRNAVVHNGVVDHGVELIGKPFTLEELASRIRAILDRSEPK